MNATISSAREVKKHNQPVVKNLEVPIEVRGKLLGMGGMNLKRIASQTGVTINSNSETGFNIFAPNQTALQEAEDIIEKLLAFKVIKLSNHLLKLNTFSKIIFFLFKETTRTRIWRRLCSQGC